MIKNIDSRYSIDELGNVYSDGKRLNPPKYPTGYVVVKLYRNGGYTRVGVHRLVASAFIPNPENKPFVNHKNGIKHDNNVSNLEWVTSHENHIHAALNDLKAHGERHGISKLDNEKVIEIKKLIRGGVPQRMIAKMYGVCQATIKDINMGKTWKRIDASNEYANI